MISANNMKISVIMTAYNHEKFIGEAIESILIQSHKNLELIVIDDGSKDSTREIIDTYHDPRIRKIYKYNEGPSVAMNLGVKYASSDWIALMSGDDISKQNRLEMQINAAKNNNADFVFTIPELINENGIILHDSQFKFFYTSIPQTESELFHKLFVDGNFLCAPSCFMKKNCYIELGGFCETSIQLQDFIMWIQAVKKYKFKVMSSRLLQYRIHTNNLSGADKSSRITFENIMVYKTFFDNVDWDFMKKSFEEISYYSKNDEELFEIEKTFLFLKHLNPVVKIIGAERLYAQMQKESMRNKILQIENFYLKDFYTITSSLDINVMIK